MPSNVCLCLCKFHMWTIEFISSTLMRATEQWRQNILSFNLFSAGRRRPDHIRSLSGKPIPDQGHPPNRTIDWCCLVWLHFSFFIYISIRQILFRTHLSFLLLHLHTFLCVHIPTDELNWEASASCCLSRDFNDLYWVLSDTFVQTDPRRYFKQRLCTSLQLAGFTVRTSSVSSAVQPGCCCNLPVFSASMYSSHFL